MIAAVCLGHAQDSAEFLHTSMPWYGMICCTVQCVSRDDVTHEADMEDHLHGTL